jgi:hypothetical protein
MYRNKREQSLGADLLWYRLQLKYVQNEKEGFLLDVKKMSADYEDEEEFRDSLIRNAINRRIDITEQWINGNRNTFIERVEIDTLAIEEE